MKATEAVLASGGNSEGWIKVYILIWDIKSWLTFFNSANVSISLQYSNWNMLQSL